MCGQQHLGMPEVISNIKSSVDQDRIEVWSGPSLDKNSAPFSDPAVFYENYTKLYFNTKYEKIGLKRAW